MEKIWGVVLLTTVGMTALLPYIITLIISFDTAYVQKKSKIHKRISAMIITLSVSVNTVSILLSHRGLFEHWNLLRTAKKITQLSFDYQEIKFYSLLLAFSTVCSVITGFLIRWILPKLIKLQYGRAFLTVRKRTVLLLICVLVCGITVGTMFYSFNGVSNIVINEVSGFKKTRNIEESCTPHDYIELYNKGDFDWYVSKLYLSDEEANLLKWEIPECTLPAGGYGVITMEEANFSISRKGKETIYLSDEMGRILDHVSLPAVDANISYSRVEDGADVWDTITQTPNASNSQAKPKRDVSVTLSHEGGFYPDSFYLSMDTEDGYNIYYTLDGSIPDENAILYTEPIYVYDKSSEPNVFRSLQRVVLDWKNYEPDMVSVDKGFVVRAIAISNDGSFGDTTTATYFVDLEKYQDKAVVSLVANPDDLFGDDGIYVTGIDYDELYLSENVIDKSLANFIEAGRQTEISAHMEYYADEGASFQQNVGLRISGSSSREGKIKRFSVYSRNQYSDSRIFEKDFFEGITTRKIQLRNGYVNGMSQMLVADRQLATQKSIPVSLFVNGEYWLDTYILEKYDGHYFQEYYGIREDDLVICKNGAVNDWDAEDTKLRDAVYEYLENHDLSNPENYAGFAKFVDMQSYIDFMCANIYMNNTDFTESKNSIWWRSRTASNGLYADGKWRFALYDMDFVNYGVVEDRVKANIFVEDMPFVPPLSEQPIYSALKDNPDFCRQFVLTFMDMVNTNFQYENVAKILDTYDPSEDNTQYHYFFREREKYIVPYMAEEFGLTGTLENITLNQNGEGGFVRLNTVVPDMTHGGWTGQYYTDYPVVVTAVPEKGWRFVGWEGDIRSTEQILEITLPVGGISINAIFEKE